MSKTQFKYDENNNQTTNIVFRSKPDGTFAEDTTSYVFDGQNRVTKTIHADGSTSEVFYDEVGLTKETRDAYGRRTQYVYDELGQRVTTIYPDTNITEQAFYDPEGRPTNRIDRLGRQTRTGYDALGRVIAVTNAFGTAEVAITRSFYDSLGRVCYTVDGRGVTNGFGYDLAGRRTSVTNAWGTPVQMVMRYQYDSSGNVTNVINALNRETATLYDIRGRAYQTLAPPLVANGPRVVNTTGYDVANRKLTESNALGLTNTFQYDGVGRLLSVTNGLGSVVGYTGATNWVRLAYDTAGNVLFQTNALNRINCFTYDGMGRRLTSKLPAGQTTTFGYDAVGNQISVQSADGVVITNQFDIFNRLWKRWNGGTLLETYTYSASGQLTNRVDESGTHSFVYDNRDRLKQNVTPVGTLHYGYDTTGNLLSLQSATASGVSLTYAYDALNRLTNVIDNGLSTTIKTTDYCFDGVGNLSALKQNACGLTNLHQYDSRNRLTNLTWKKAGLDRSSFTYTPDILGNRSQLAETVNGVSRAYVWTYDNLRRLQTENLSGGTTGNYVYGLDLLGNRTSRTGTLGAVQSPLHYDQNDWIDNDSITNNANGYFDAKGNTLSYGGSTYTYDWANRLRTGPGVTAIVYDAEGNRIKKTAGLTTTWYLVATVNPTGYPQVVEEKVGANITTATLSRVYGYGLDLLHQRQMPGNTPNFYGYDGQGTVRFLVDANGAITDTYVYDSYGNQIPGASTGTTPNWYRYTGEQWDPDLGMYYLRARYYQPTLGRFWTIDTHEGSPSDPLSLHRYLYAHGNPVNMVDPSGHEGEAISQSGVGALGSSLATHGGSALARGYGRVLLTYAWTLENPAYFALASEVGLFGASFLPDVLEAAADLGSSLNRQGARSEGGFSPGIVRGVEAEESILRPAIENVGGKFLGGTVKGIDGQLAVTSGDILIQGKTHEVASDRLLGTITRGMEKFSTVDEIELNGERSASVGGGAYQRPPGPAAGKIYTVLVPETSARTIVSPAFINGLRQVAERTKVIPIVRIVRGWRGVPR